MEQVLEAYSAAQIAKWERAWTNHRNKKEALLYYVPPKYRLDKPQPESRESTDKKDNYEVIYQHTEEDTLTELLTKSGQRLCLWNDPGAGKTIFTRRLRAFLSCQAGRDALANGKPLFAVRREETKLDGSWPTDYVNNLAKDLERFAADRNESAQEVVKWALKQGRVILILDALDQATTDRINNFKAFLSEIDQEGWNLRIIVTGRPFAVQQQSGVSGFVNDDWQMGGILPFDRRQQYDYLRGPQHMTAATSKTDAWRNRDLRGIELDDSRVAAATNESEKAISTALVAWLPHYEQVAELLSNPDNLRFAKDLDKQGKLANVHNRTDLYLETCLHSLTRGADNVLQRSPTPQELKKWETLLAAAGFATMAKDPHHFEIEGAREIGCFQEAVERYGGFTISEQDWQDLNRFTAFTSRAILREASPYLWAWPNRRMMEFYCGLHLARNSQPNWIDDQSTQLRCGDPTLRRHAGDPQWTEPFLFAMEMPSEVRQDDRLRASLAELFQPEAGANTGNRRPTELMSYAVGLLQKQPPHLRESHFPEQAIQGGEQVIQEYQAQFTRLLAAVTPEQQRLIAEQLSLNNQRKPRLNAAVPKEKPQHPNFVPCPPEENPTLEQRTFLMGAPESEKNSEYGGDDERPLHRVTLNPFYLQSTAVTVEQFALFDGQYTTVEKPSLIVYANQPTCPAIEISWCDAFMFALWLQGRLPTEAEWEYACRARTETVFNFGNELKGTTQANVHGDYLNGTDTKGRNLGQTSVVGSYAPSAWRLYDMHGNVREWCQDWYAENYYADCVKENPCGPKEGYGRVLRGGSWNRLARDARSANRRKDWPDNRCDDYGFRILLPQSDSITEDMPEIVQQPTPEHAEIIACFNKLHFHENISLLQLFWCIGRYEHNALTTCSRALGLNNLAKKLNELIALNCMPPFKINEGTLIECIDNLAGILDKPPFSDAGLFKNDEGFPELREDFPNGKRPGKRWTGFARHAWESIELFLRSKDIVPKMELIPKQDHPSN